MASISSTNDAAHSIDVSVRSCPPEHASRGIIWISAGDLAALGLTPGHAVSLTSETGLCAYGRAVPSPLAAQGSVLIDTAGRSNAGLGIGDTASLNSLTTDNARSIRLAGPADAPSETQINHFNGHVVGKGHSLWLPLGEGQMQFQVVESDPAGPIVVTEDTTIGFDRDESLDQGSAIAFEDIGGLGPELERVRELVELPITQPDLFEKYGISPPRGILLSGPPGCGKTLIARAVAREADAAFFSIAGPEVADKHFGESEARIREVFDAAQAAAPAIIFIDEIESIAPSREGLSGEKQVERRMVATLLTLMDGLSNRGSVVVLAATNLPDLLDPALRRPGRFDRELQIRPPDEDGRREILGVHTRNVPLASDVDLVEIARRTQGFVGADLASLVREAGMSAIRRRANHSEAANDVNATDFDEALLDVSPSILRSFKVDVPKVRWDEVAGLGEAKRHLRQAVEWPMKYPDHFAAMRLKPPRGVLMYGPPGTGKTLLARAVASAANANFIAVNGGELVSQYLGESERAVRDVFKQARQSAPTVLFFDELDALASPRSDKASETSDRIVAQLLTELDGIEPLRGVLVLAATNRADRIDPALTRSGRFDVKVEVGLPDEGGLAQLLAVKLVGVPTSDTLDLAKLAVQAKGMSGADIEAVVSRASMACLEQALESSSTPAASELELSHAMLELAITEQRKSVL
ncbi:MAG: AAA family ATPase [Pseudomonadota bacterium]